MNPGRQQLDLSLLLDRVRDRRVVPFVGAGLSSGIYPDWGTLLKSMCAEAGLTHAELAAYSSAAIAEMVRGHCSGDLSALAEGSMQVPVNNQPAPLPRHQLIARGRWAGIITTNWDDLIEKAWPRGSADDRSELPHLRHGNEMVARYRHQAQLFVSEMRSGVEPPPLMKLHGDFTDRGRSEFVLGHRDYRRLLARDLDARATMSWLASEYSFLFYGTSLTDSDVLGVLDEVHESLGHSIGPHFWLLGSEVPEAYIEFLRLNYGVRVLAEPNWRAAEKRLAEVSRASWPLDTPGESWECRAGNLTVRIERGEIPSKPASDQAVAASVALVRGGQGLPSGATVEALGVQRAVEKLNADPGTARQLDGHPGVWAVFGQEPGRHGRTSHVHRAVCDLVTAVRAEAKFTRIELPLVAAGGGGLTPTDTLCAMLHALGVVADGTPLAVTIHVKDSGEDSDPLNEILDGRLHPARILARARAGITFVRVVYRVGPSWHSASVLLPSGPTAADLQKALPEWPRGEPMTLNVTRYQRGAHSMTRKPDDLLFKADVTDSTLVRIEPIEDELVPTRRDHSA